MVAVGTPVFPNSETHQARYQSIPDEFRYQGDGLEDALQSVRHAVDSGANEVARSTVG